MATVRDAGRTIAFFEGRQVLDPNTIPFTDWVSMIDSTVKVMAPKHLHGFQAAKDIVAKPVLNEHSELPHRYNAPPARIYLGVPGKSWEFEWHLQYLICGMRFSVESTAKPKTISQEYLLFGRNSCFLVLNTMWYLHEDGRYRLSSNTNDGHLKARHVSTPGVVEWCFEDKEDGPYLLRRVLEIFYAATEETVDDLEGKLKRATEQCRAVGRRLSTISWVKPGEEVWIVCHSHSYDRHLNNEYSPISRRVLKIEKGMAHFEDERPRHLWDCYRTENECRAACPAPHRDD